MSGTAVGVVLFRLGRDRALGLVRRLLARVLSFYQRAPIHVLADAEWGDFDWMMSSLLRGVLLRFCRRRVRYWREQPTVALPSSGWPGSLFVLAVWAIVIAAAISLLPA